MADIFLNSVDGNDADDGSTWALAKATLATGIAAVDTTNQRVVIDSAHSESAATISYTSPGTPAAPCQLLSVTQTGASGISALTAGALFATTGTTTVFDGSIYAYGVTIRNSSASSNEIALGSAATNVNQVWDNCAFEHTGAGSGSTFKIGNVASGGGSRLVVTGSTFKFGHAAQSIAVAGDIRIKGGGVAAGGTSPTAVFKPGGSVARGGAFTIEGFDFSNCSASVNLCGGGQGGYRAILRDCKVPASWSGAPYASPIAGFRVECWGAWNATTLWRAWVVDYAYTLTDSETIYKSGGAQDDTTGYSWKIVTTANVAYPTSHAISPEMLINNTVTGSSRTVTVDIVHDNVTALTDAEVWLEVEYIGTGGLGTVASDAPANVITTAASQTSSSATWTTTGMTNPNKQQLSVAFTPSQKGYFICRVCVAKASYTLYVDPKPVLS